MAEQKRNNTLFVYLAILFLCASSVSVSARVVLPLFQSYGKPIFRSNFHTVYDTSKYGVFQLSNGLAQTPQMGFVSLSLSGSFAFNWCNFWVAATN